MLWSILILTQPSRSRFLARLLGVLKPQVEQYSDVEVVTRLFDTKLDLGSNRQAMVDAATGQYISFVDDDDLVPANYVSSIYPLLDGVDYIGFRIQLFINGQKQPPTFHSLKYKEWNGDQRGWYRDLSYMNPIRRKLALAVPISGGYGEDERWATGMRRLGIVKTEHVLDDVMYLYYLRTDKSDCPGGAIPPAGARYDPIEQQNFIIGQRRPVCPECGSKATALAGGMRRCNQCAASWI